MSDSPCSGGGDEFGLEMAWHGRGPVIEWPRRSVPLAALIHMCRRVTKAAERKRDTVINSQAATEFLASTAFSITFSSELRVKCSPYDGAGRGFLEAEGSRCPGMNSGQNSSLDTGLNSYLDT